MGGATGERSKEAKEAWKVEEDDVDGWGAWPASGDE